MNHETQIRVYPTVNLNAGAPPGCALTRTRRATFDDIRRVDAVIVSMFPGAAIGSRVATNP
jgi:hypothetical protein